MKFTVRILLVCAFLILLYSPRPVNAQTRAFRVESPDGKYAAYLRENGDTYLRIDPPISPYRGIEKTPFPGADLFLAQRIDGKDSKEQLLQTGIAMPFDTAGGFTLEIQTIWTRDSRYLIYRWRNLIQQEQLAIYDTVSGTQKVIIVQDRLRRAKIPPNLVRLESVSPDGQFMAFQQGERLVFYSIPNLERNEPSLQNAYLISVARTCHMFFDGLMSYCVYWSPSGHLATYTTSIRGIDYLVVFDPAGKEKTRLSRLPDLQPDKRHTSFIAWSPNAQCIAVMILRWGDVPQLNRMSLDYHTTFGTSRSIADSILYQDGEGITPYVYWCKPDVIAYIDAKKNEAVAYSVTRKSYEYSLPFEQPYPESEAVSEAIAKLRLCR